MKLARRFFRAMLGVGWLPIDGATAFLGEAPKPIGAIVNAQGDLVSTYRCDVYWSKRDKPYSPVMYGFHHKGLAMYGTMSDEVLLGADKIQPVAPIKMFGVQR